MEVAVFVGASIDGFIAAADGSLDFLRPFEGEDHGYSDLMAGVDTLVVGRGTYDTALGFDAWPYDGKRVAVLTHRPVDARHGETAYAGPLADLFERLATEGARRIYLDGGVAIRQGLDAGLVDELTIATVPVTVGVGRPLFPPGAERVTPWRLVATRAFPSGVVQSRYRRD